jgi:hypothetical protein
MPLVEQELLTLSDHQVFSGDHVTKSFSFLCSVWSTIVYPFTFGHYIVSSSLIYNSRLLLWYLQTVLSLGAIVVMVVW